MRPWRWAAASLFLAGCAHPGPAPRAQTADRVVDVGDAQMHAVLRPGRSEVVILLEAGATLDAGSWSKVIAAIEGRTDATIIAYDRAGMGRSTPLATPYAIADEVMRLHRLLDQLAQKRKLVLVGHSYGGFLIQAYANLYPAEVAGMVYVDANTVEGIGGIAGAQKLIESILASDAAGKAGFNDKRLAHAYVDTVHAMAALPPPCGIPIAVVTQGDEAGGTDPAALRQWRKGHAALAARWGAPLRYAPGSGHFIPEDRPDLVADAILWTVGEAGKRKHAPLPSFPPAESSCEK
ncbi:MAG: alpha/beta fold hydrolase [Sphingopyxis sp.]|nr:alpha/beta fold hydrolase [Sphingopyxis sp.]